MAIENPYLKEAVRRACSGESEAEARDRLGNEPTQEDITRAALTLASSTLALAGQLMGALEAGRAHFPPEAKPIVDDLSKRFHATERDMQATLGKLAA